MLALNYVNVNLIVDYTLQYSLIEYDLLGVFAKKNFFCCVEMNENHITRLLKS